MHVLRRLPAFLALLLLGAHFLRAGTSLLTALALLLIVPLWLRQQVARSVLGAALGLGALVWTWTLAQNVQARMAAGLPWMRMAFILGAVAVFTVWSAWLLRPWPLKRPA